MEELKRIIQDPQGRPDDLIEREYTDIINLALTQGDTFIIKFMIDYYNEYIQKYILTFEIFVLSSVSRRKIYKELIKVIKAKELTIPEEWIDRIRPKNNIHEFWCDYFSLGRQGIEKIIYDRDYPLILVADIVKKTGYDLNKNRGEYLNNLIWNDNSSTQRFEWGLKEIFKNVDTNLLDISFCKTAIFDSEIFSVNLYMLIKAGFKRIPRDIFKSINLDRTYEYIYAFTKALRKSNIVDYYTEHNKLLAYYIKNFDHPRFAYNKENIRDSINYWNLKDCASVITPDSDPELIKKFTNFVVFREDIRKELNLKISNSFPLLLLLCNKDQKTGWKEVCKIYGDSVYYYMVKYGNGTGKLMFFRYVKPSVWIIERILSEFGEDLYGIAGLCDNTFKLYEFLDINYPEIIDKYPNLVNLRNIIQGGDKIATFNYLISIGDIAGVRELLNKGDATLNDIDYQYVIELLRSSTDNFMKFVQDIKPLSLDIDILSATRDVYPISFVMDIYYTYYKSEVSPIAYYFKLYLYTNPKKLKDMLEIDVNDINKNLLDDASIPEGYLIDIGAKITELKPENLKKVNVFNLELVVKYLYEMEWEYTKDIHILAYNEEKKDIEYDFGYFEALDSITTNDSEKEFNPESIRFFINTSIDSQNIIDLTKFSQDITDELKFNPESLCYNENIVGYETYRKFIEETISPSLELFSLEDLSACNYEPYFVLLMLGNYQNVEQVYNTLGDLVFYKRLFEIIIRDLREFNIEQEINIPYKLKFNNIEDIMVVINSFEGDIDQTNGELLMQIFINCIDGDANPNEVLQFVIENMSETFIDYFTELYQNNIDEWNKVQRERVLREQARAELAERALHEIERARIAVEAESKREQVVVNNKHCENDFDIFGEPINILKEGVIVIQAGENHYCFTKEELIEYAKNARDTFIRNGIPLKKIYKLPFVEKAILMDRDFERTVIRAPIDKKLGILTPSGDVLPNGNKIYVLSNFEML